MLSAYLPSSPAKLPSKPEHTMTTKPNPPEGPADGQPHGHDTTATSRPSAAALDRIGDALRGLRYGSVLAIVQDGVVVQIERTEKTRLGK